MKLTKSNNPEEFFLLGYNAVWSVESQPTFRNNMSPPFQGRGISQARNQNFLLPEGGGELFLQNIGWLSTDYTALYPRRRTLHNHRCENLKIFIAIIISQRCRISSKSVKRFKAYVQMLI
jgi:hypothetical protein